jgi:AcrR family transcriptional regulator
MHATERAALALFRERGYEETTAAEIAAKAGVTERTFFRHFPDKREVLFDGDAAFVEALSAAVRRAPADLGPWDTLQFAFNTVKHIFVENRPFTEPRHRVIADNPTLQERAMAKTRAQVAAVTAALCERGLTAPQANLVAWMGMAIFSHGVAAWFANGSIDLSDHIANAFREARALSAPSVPATKPGAKKEVSSRKARSKRTR